MKPNILCIEDQPDNMMLIRRLFRPDGYNLIEAKTGVQGLSIVESQELDLVLLDINLPDIDGYEAARGMRASTPSVRLVALTGYGRPEDRQRALDAGFDSYLLKPVDPHRLVEIITPPESRPIR